MAVLEGACGKLGTDLSQVIALQVTVRDTVEEGDTLRAHAVPFTGAGDSVAAPISWACLDTAFLTVVDTVAGTFVGNEAGTARIQARSGNLRSNPLSIVVTAAADTLVATRPAADTISIAARDSLSDSLAVLLADTTTNAPPTPPTVNPLGSRPVQFAITHAPAGATVTLATSDTAHAVATTDTVLTNTTGIAGVKVRYLGGGALPDSVIVAASAKRAVGTTVPGSPVTFVVQLRP